MTLILGSEQVDRCVDMRQLISAIESGMREIAAGNVEQPERMNLRAGDGFFRVMPAVLNDSGLMGFKVFYGGQKRGVRYLVAVCEAKEGRLLALMDAHYLTAARTGAGTGVATKYLARSNASTAAVIGSGLEARTNLTAVCAVRRLSSVRVYSPNPDNRERFAREMTEKLKVSITAVATPEECAKGADIVVVATNSQGRSQNIAFHGRWMEPGMHVNAIGSTATFLREIDPETFSTADVVVLDAPASQMARESGDVMEAVKTGHFKGEEAREIHELIVGKVEGRTSPQQITLYKSVGNAVQDVVSGFAVYQEAVRRGLGTDVGEFLENKLF